VLRDEIEGGREGRREFRFFVSVQFFFFTTIDSLTFGDTVAAIKGKEDPVFSSFRSNGLFLDELSH
jgi:hypothetical protein